ncbi:hypothetical protein [Metamycoplasma hominis]|uniref:Uncharacterized protein n=1 Tax=Metamycoplasma hominis TaxID=2098 RepID=A0A6A8Q4Q7_METHO|nr:hypothetical protein [Metamycoplasma hominis]MTH76089.1 hypothetical protein [Metamycoplasma hominis]
MHIDEFIDKYRRNLKQSGFNKDNIDFFLSGLELGLNIKIKSSRNYYNFKKSIHYSSNNSHPSSLSDFDKTPTDLQDSKVINEYNKSQKESKASQSQSKSHSLTK